MDDAIFVEVRKTIKDLPTPFLDNFTLNTLCFLSVLLECSRRHNLCNENDLIVHRLVEDSVEAKDMLVIKVLQDLNFLVDLCSRYFSKIMFNNRILSSNDMPIITDILDGEYGYHWSSSCEYSFWVIKETNFAPDKFSPLTRSDPFVTKVLDSTLLVNVTDNIGMSYEDFSNLIETDVIKLPMLEDEESVATALMIIGTSSTEGLQSGVSTDEGNESLGDG